ncbi:hypothetical protein ACEK07_46835 [Alcanivoracaceae bacterium MT1]
MGINLETLLVVLLLWSLLCGGMAYILAKPKFEAPIIISVITFFMSFIPPLSLIFLAVIALSSSSRPNRQA